MRAVRKTKTISGPGGPRSGKKLTPPQHPPAVLQVPHRPPHMARAHHVPALWLVVGAGGWPGVVDEIGDADGIGVPRAGGLEDRRLGAVGAKRAAHAGGHEVHVARQALGTAEIALVE